MCSTEVLSCLFPGVLWLWHFLYSVVPQPVSSLHIYTCVAGIHGGCGQPSRRCRLLPGKCSYLWFAGVSKYPSWCSIVAATVTVHQFFCILHFGGSCGIRGEILLNENAIIILSLNQSECRKRLRTASSRIGFSLDTGIEESTCKSSCRPLFLAIIKRSSKDLFSLCFLLDRPLRLWGAVLQPLL